MHARARDEHPSRGAGQCLALQQRADMTHPRSVQGATLPVGVAGFASGEVGALLRSLECRLVNNCAFFARLRLRFELAACKTLASSPHHNPGKAKSCATDSQAQQGSKT